MKELRLLSPYGILGCGLPESSSLNGMAMSPDTIAADAGSIDASPRKLGAGVMIVGRRACREDLEIMVTNGVKAKIPVVIGSARGAGGRVHVEWTLSIVEEILKEHGLQHLKLIVVWADMEKKVVKQRLSGGKIDPLGLTVSKLTPERIEKTTGIVTQMGHEPIVRALEQGADIIVCGCAYDPSLFAVVAVFHGFDMAYSYHAGKVLECAALCAQPGTTEDCILGIIREDGFVVTPLSEDRICTKTSVTAHTFYERDHPYLLHGPGIVLNLGHCTFIGLEDGRSVFIVGSWIERTDPYRTKLEGAMPVAFRIFVVAGIHDPLLIGQLEEVQDKVKAQVRGYYSDVDEKDYKINSINYGINGVMGRMESCRDLPHKVGVVFEVVVKMQELVDTVCSSIRSTFLHYEYEGRRSTAGNLAFPFAPNDVPFGRAYEFPLYHLMDVRDGEEMFPMEEWKGGDT